MYTCCISRLKPMNPKSTTPLSTKTRLVILVLSSAAALHFQAFAQPDNPTNPAHPVNPIKPGKPKHGRRKTTARLRRHFLALMNQEIANGKGHETVGFNPILISLPNKPFTPREPLPISARKTDCKGFRKKHWAMLKSRLKCTPVMAY
jgi:hypothetical protein